MTASQDITGAERPEEIDSRYSWIRLGFAMLISTIGGVGMWSVVVALPAVQADFGVLRADATLPFTLTMAGFGLGGIAMGRVADRLGVVIPLAIGACALGLGYVAAGLGPSLWLYALAHMLVGFGASATFGPLMTDVSYWFVRRRGIAVALCASGNYIAGAIWPSIVQHFIATSGWRATHIGIGLFVVLAMPPLILTLRRRPSLRQLTPSAAGGGSRGSLDLSPRALQVLLAVAGVACCVAMAMPQVHIVAYCADLGYGVARGAEMLSLMLACGIISRVASGFIADRIGGLGTLLLGSFLQGVALLLYLMFDGMISLYIISALFGLFQGGIVPSYAIVIREYFAPREAGTRLGIVLMATLVGMAGGGWLSGAIFDHTGSYAAAFANGVAWNFLNLIIVTFLILRPKAQRLAPA